MIFLKGNENCSSNGGRGKTLNLSHFDTLRSSKAEFMLENASVSLDFTIQGEMNVPWKL